MWSVEDSRVLGVDYQYEDEYDDAGDWQAGRAEPESDATLGVSALPVHRRRVTWPAREHDRQHAYNITTNQ